MSRHRHFHYDDVMIIMLYVFNTNSTISYHLKASLYISGSQPRGRLVIFLESRNHEI